MNHPDEQALEEALTALEQLSKRKKAPGRWEARALLVPLGMLLQARGEEALATPLGRARAAAGADAKSWAEAVTEELSLACAEHIQGVDPRYLDLPNFDFDYVLQARERLEARLVAARALGVEAPKQLAEQVTEADARLKPYLDARRKSAESP
ncbi:MAG: hypothetical protein AAF682_22445 [Planctomycetota bacterium]